LVFRQTTLKEDQDREGKDDTGERFVTVLEIPPVDSPQTAIKVAIAAEVRGKK
jgi:hypothetical protein